MPISSERVNLLKAQGISTKEVTYVSNPQIYSSGMFKNYWDYCKKTKDNPLRWFIYIKLWKYNMVRIRLATFLNSVISIRLIEKN
tara:strand:+ start:293 stop:547 length:255 start_codon:yes stop_codon:yes gene_type:complete